MEDEAHTAALEEEEIPEAYADLADPDDEDYGSLPDLVDDDTPYLNTHTIQHEDDEDADADDTGDAETDPTGLGLGSTPLMTVCPVCEMGVSVMELVFHMHMYHPSFFMLWSSLAYPSLSMPDLFNLTSTLQEDYEEELSYEYLSQLCENIGNHYVGLTQEQMDEVAPRRFSYTKEDQASTCPICLEGFMEQVIVRTIKPCGHSYCSDCLEKWLSMHKTCPVCKTYLDPEPKTEEAI